MLGRCLLSLCAAAVCVRCVKAEGDLPVLLGANLATIRKLDLATEEFTDVIRGRKWSVSVDYHYQKGIMVWAEYYNRKIYSVPLEGYSPITELVDLSFIPEDVAVDWVHDNLYWSDMGKPLIGVSRLDGSLVKTLFDEEGTDDPRAIALDPTEGLLFWADWGYEPRIQRSGMDGSHRTVIVSAESLGRSLFPNGLALDFESQTIYWADRKAHTLSSASYDGTDVRVLISSSSIIRHPYSLDIMGDYLYWNDCTKERGSIYRSNRHTGGGVMEVIGGGNWSSLRRIRVLDRSKQIPGLNRCINNGGCSHLCLPSPLRYGGVDHSCACPDGVLPTDNCSTVAKDFSSDAESIRWRDPMYLSFVLALLALVIFYAQ